MTKICRVLAVILSLAVAVEPAFAGNESVKPTPDPLPAPQPLPAGARLGGLQPIHLGVDGLEPVQVNGVQDARTISAPTVESSLDGARTQLPAAAITGPQTGPLAQPDASSLTVPVAAGTAASETGNPNSSAKLKPGAGKTGEFGGAAASKPGELEEKVWEHAEARGFQRKADGEEIEGAENAAQSLPAATAKGAKGEAAVPAPAKKEQLSVLSGKVLGFFSTFLFVQLAVESLALAVPQMTDPLKNGFIALAGLASTSYVAYALGSFLGGRLVQKLGLARVYRLVLSSRVLIWGAVAALFHAHGGSVPIAPLIGLFSLDYFVHSMGRVAERTLQGEWFKDSPAASNRFGTMRDFVEYGTVFTTMGTGLVIATMGFGAIIYAAPLMFLAAAGLAFALRSLPQKLSEKSRKVPWFAGFKRLFSKDMKAIYLSRLLINNFVYLLYYVTGTAFGVFFAHGNAGLAAAASSALIGLLGMGANAAAITNAGISQRIEKDTESVPEAGRGAAQSKLMSTSAAKALRWASVAMLGGWLFVSHASLGTVAGPLLFAAPILGVAGILGLAIKTILTARREKISAWQALKKSWLWAAMAVGGWGFVLAKAHLAPYLIWPLFAISPALVLIGYTGQVALTQLDTLLLDKMPRRTKAYVVGADRALTNLTYAVNFLVWGALFQFFGAAAFIGLGVYCTLTALGYLVLSKRVAPPPAK